jgi:hypothetical protein
MARIVIAQVLIAVALGKMPLTPLKWWHWFLLGLGPTQVPLAKTERLSKNVGRILTRRSNDQKLGTPRRYLTLEAYA